MGSQRQLPLKAVRSKMRAVPGRRHTPSLWRLTSEGEAAWERERFLVAVLDRDRKVVGLKEIPAGGVEAAAQLRKVFKPGLFPNAAGFICIQNHPDTNPGTPEVNRTLAKRLQELAALLGVPLLEHVIFSNGCYHWLANKS